MNDLKTAVNDLNKTLAAHSFYGVQGTFVGELKAKVARVVEEVTKLQPEEMAEEAEEKTEE